MIKLHQFPLVWGRNVSPFTLKLESWLKLAKLPYQVVTVRNPSKGPKGKLPFIEDQDGTLVGDSSLIIEHLKRTRSIDPDHELDQHQRATALALQRLFEDHFYFILSYSRWCDPEGWRHVEPAFFGFLPPGVRQIVPRFLQRQVRQMLQHQGLGRHSREEIYAFGRTDLEAVSTLLGNRQYFLGEEPTTIDAIAYGFLANLLLVPVETELKQIGEEYANLRTFCEGLASGLGDPA